MVLDNGINFAKQLVKATSQRCPLPAIPYTIVQGGAGTGKSHVINLLSQWIEKILRSPGDNLNHPYVVKCAFSGTAASNIGGQTLHSAFNLGFGNTFNSLNDKVRDVKRNILCNLRILIIDEYSMVKSDMLYQLDLRLKEIKQEPNLPFGGVSVCLFGDLLQLKPVLGSYPFESPKNEQFKITHLLDPLWDIFDVIDLKINHRQGNDKIYADLLNRIRVGQQNDADLKLLSSRLKDKNDSTIPKDAVFIYARNEDVNEMNNICLEELESQESIFEAFVQHKTMKNYKPFVENTGNIKNTALQKTLKLKVGAKVMLTYNLDTTDGLTNGAFGEVLGYDILDNGVIRNVHVNFYDESVGKEYRKKFLEFQKLYPGKRVTPIERYECTFNIGNRNEISASKANALQFPLKLSYAVTAHKIQGQTIKKPIPVVVDLNRARNEAQVYVMLSRAQELDQIIILDKLYENIWKVSHKALTEVQRLSSKALNAIKEKKTNVINILSFNILSLRKHYEDLRMIRNLSQLDVICLQETWLAKNTNTIDYQMSDFNLNLNSHGPGKGVAVYFKPEYEHADNICNDNLQISKLNSKYLDIITVYRSTGNTSLKEELMKLIDNERPCLICGDFNIDFQTEKDKSDFIIASEEIGFVQIVTRSTHIKGGLLDHVYANKLLLKSKISISQINTYLSDHDAILISIETVLFKAF